MDGRRHKDDTQSLARATGQTVPSRVSQVHEKAVAAASLRSHPWQEPCCVPVTTLDKQQETKVSLGLE